MKSLRIRISLLLVVSIVAVVGLATGAAIFVLGSRVPESFAKPIVLQINTLIPLLASRDSDPSSPEPLVTLRAPTGRPLEGFTQVVQEALRASGATNRVVVTETADRNIAAVWVELPTRGWFAIPIPDRPTHGSEWFALASWMALIIAGAIAIALAIAHRMARPLALLERIASTISQNGQMSVVPETGPAEVRATARALNRLTANLKAAMESRMRLVAAAGHDLRTPITRLRLRAEFLPEDDQAVWIRDLDELRRIADSSNSACARGSSNDTQQSVRLDVLTQAAVKELVETGLSIEVLQSTPVLIRGAPLAVTRVLRNILVNAATHGKGCKVQIEPRQQWGVVVIEDKGPGIPEAVINRVFEPFFRIDPARTQFIPGAGLGLAIAKEIVERHRGEIVLSNLSAGGLRQEIRLPSVTEQRSLASQAPIDATTASRHGADREVRSSARADI